MESEEAVLPWLRMITPALSANGLSAATSELDCGPTKIRTPSPASVLSRSRAWAGSSPVSSTRTLTRVGEPSPLSRALRSSAAKWSAASLVWPRVRPGPVSESSAPTTSWSEPAGAIASSLHAATHSASTRTSVRFMKPPCGKGLPREG